MRYTEEKTNKILNKIYVMRGSKVVAINPLTWVILAICLIIFTIGYLLSGIREVYIFIKEDVSWYDYGFKGSRAYPYWDLVKTYVVFVLLHRWNKLDERHLSFFDEHPNSSLGGKWMIAKLKRINGVPQ